MHSGFNSLDNQRAFEFGNASEYPRRNALVHKTATEEPGRLLGRSVPRLSSSEVTQRYLHAIAGYSSGTCSQPGETLEPQGVSNGCTDSVQSGETPIISNRGRSSTPPFEQAFAQLCGNQGNLRRQYVSARCLLTERERWCSMKGRGSRFQAEASAWFDVKSHG